jgi:hypothetical protein
MKKILITTLLSGAALLANGQNWTFDDLDNWTYNPTHVSIATAPAGMDGNALLLQGTQASQMSYMTWTGLLGTLTAGQPQVSFQFQVFDTEPMNPTELFIRLNGWNDFVAIKETDEDNDTMIIEVRAGNAGSWDPIVAPISFGTVHEVVLDYVAGDAVNVTLDGTLLGSVTGQPWNVDTSFSALSINSQKATSYVDNLSIAVPEPSTYAALLGLLALGFVAWRRRR